MLEYLLKARVIMDDPVDKEYFDFLDGKTVAIVCPADTNEIVDLDNKFDIIVRSNSDCPVKNFRFGKRCDILYSCMTTLHEMYYTEKAYKELLTQPDLKYVCASFKRNFSTSSILTEKRIEVFQKLHNQFNGNFKFHIVDTEAMKKLWHFITPSCPLTGVISLAEVFHSTAKSINIFGMSFYIGGYFKEYNSNAAGMTDDDKKDWVKTINHGGHILLPQVKYVRSIISERVIPDKILKNILDTPDDELLKLFNREIKAI